MSRADVDALVMSCETADDAEPEKLASPAYDALMLCVPAVNDVSDRVPFPFASRVAVPIVALPSLKLTLPVGIPEAPPAADTDAVKVTAWPKALGFGALIRVVVDEFLFTVCASADEVPGV